MRNSSIAVIMTCHNRRETTLSCLRNLYAQNGLGGKFHIQVYLTDDGCTDGSRDAVLAEFPNIRVIDGNGLLFWNRGMHEAFGAAMKDRHDQYLWLNDDTMLTSDAIIRLLETFSVLRDRGVDLPIIVGSINTPDNKGHWGGCNRLHPWRPHASKPVSPEDTEVMCDTFCGNCVMIPSVVAERVGNLDPIFTHSFGDTDYGLRAARLGCKSFVAPGYFGLCKDSPSFLLGRSCFKRIFHIFSPKGYPLREGLVFCRRYAGPFWLLIWFCLCLKIVFRR